MSNYYKPFGRFSVFPPVIKNLLILNGAVFFLQVILNNIQGGGLIYKWFALNPLGEPFNFQVWQLVTYQFMHSIGGISHILFNMFALWMFGMEIENYWGSKKFLIYYLTCGVVAGLFQLIFPPLFGTAPGITIGASGAVFGVLIAFGLMFPDRYIFLWFLVPIRAKYLIGFIILLELFWIGDVGSNVAHTAHLGGALAGFLIIMFDKSIDVPLKRMFHGSSFGTTNRFTNPFSGFTNKLKSKETKIEDAKFYDINSSDKEDNEITQDEIDRILDKISQSGYQNLTEKEKKILFEASKKMN